MPDLDVPVHIRLVTWRDEPVIKIRHGAEFVRIPLDRARRVVDVVHDLVDEYESQFREEDSHGPLKES